MSALWATAEERGRLDPSQQLVWLMDGYRYSQIVYVLARLRVPDVLAGEPKRTDALAPLVNANADALQRLLRAAANLGLVTEVEPSTFALTPLGALLRSNEVGSRRDQALALVGRGHWEPWAHLEHVIRSGESACKRALGMDLWDYYRKHPKEGEHFARAMGYRTGSAKGIVDACDLAGVATIVDIGGSEGVLLEAFLDAAPQAMGILFDSPDVIARVRASVRDRTFADRIEMDGGDFFEHVSPGGDLYLVKNILHDWDDANCLHLFGNIYRASAPTSGLIVIGAVLSETSNPTSVTMADLNMLVLFGGRERTEKELGRLLGQAGFRLERIVHTENRMVSVIEAVKR